MKKNYYLLAIGFFLLHVTIQAQQKDEIQIAFDDIFSKINKTAITTGLLYDNTLHESKLLRFDGKRDTVLGGYDWKNMYRELYNMQIKTLATPLPQPDVLFNKTMQLYTKGINPLIIMNMDYNLIKADAFQNRLLDTLNNRIIDVLGRTQSPYETRQIFAFSPAHANMGYNPVKFYLGSEYYFTNKLGSLPKIEIDFGDGNGFRSVSWNSYVSVNYYTSSALRTIKIRILSQSLTASSTYEPPAIAIHSTPPVFYKQPPIPSSIAPNGEYEKKITADIPYNGEVLSGYYTVSFARNPQTGRANKYLTRPVILVEGIDFGYKDQPSYGLNSWNKCGSLGFVDLAAGKNHTYDKNGERITQPFEDGNLTLAPDLIKALNNNGYDFIYLDFEKGAEYMQKNAMVLVKLIQEINSLKQDPCEELVVVGASMGGQVARYALCYMEQKKLPHNVRLFGSFDSPNNGANIPIGFQYYIDYYSDKPIFFDAAKDAKDRKLTTPAARQLLLYHFEMYGLPHPLRTKFLDELKAMGDYPQKMRKIAVANGSGTATTQNFKAGDKLLYMNIPTSSTLTAIAGGIAAGPLWPAGATIGILVGKHIVHNYEAYVYAVQNGSTNVFSGTSPNNSWTKKNSQPGTLAYDNCPGGTNAATYSSAFPSKESLFSGLLVDTYGGPSSFMATVSALGLKPPYNTDLFQNVSLLDEENPDPSITPFNAIHYTKPTDSKQNQPHVTITNDNINWFIDQLKFSDPSLQTDRLQATLPWITNNKTYTTYNYGNNQNLNISIPGVSIASGGKLRVNNDANTGYGDGPVPEYGSNFEIKTNECGRLIELDNGGEFILGSIYTGDKRGDNTAIVHISPGSTLKIKSGGRLIINNNSTLIIEPGAKLIYEKGAEIQLLGDNAVLEINGTLELGNSAIFTFTYPNSNSGFVRFNKPMTNPWALPKNIIAGKNASMNFIGTNRNDKVLEVLQEGIYPPDNLYRFSVRDGIVALGAGSRISPLGINTAISFSNARVTSSTGTGNKHRGLAIFGQKNVTITNCQFDLGEYGIYAFLTYGGNPLTISNTSFQSCQYGLWSHDIGVSLYNCTFNGCAEGWHAAGMSRNSNAGNSNFGRNIHAITFNGGRGSSLYLDNPNISDNFTGVKVSGSTSLRVQCGNISNNNFNKGYGVFLQNNANLFLDAHKITKPTGLSGQIAGEEILITVPSQVDLSNNGITIKTDDAGMLYLSNGNNNFQPEKPYDRGNIISGTLDISCFSMHPIDASGNKWNMWGGGPYPWQNDLKTPFSFSCSGKGHQNQIIVQDNSPLSVFTGCNSPDPNAVQFGKKEQDPLASCPNCPTINTVSFKNTPLNTAVQQAINTTTAVNSTAGNDLTAINMFSQILTVPVPQQSHWRVGYLNNLAYTKMTKALGRAFNSGAITAVGAIIPEPVQQVLAVQQTFLRQFPTKGNTARAFYISMDKGQVYRLANQRQKALQVFDSISSCAALDTNQTSYLNYWRNITYAEHLVLTGQIPKENFQQLMQQGTKGMAPYLSSTGINYITPDTTLVTYGVGDTVKFSPSEYSVTYNWNFGDCASSTAINPTHVYTAPGTYIITLTQAFACTTKTRTTTLTIYPHPQAAFAIMAPACPLKENFQFINTSLPFGNWAGASSACTTQGSFTALDTNLLRVEYTWNFADGTSTTDTAKANITHQYTVAGTYPVTLTAQLQTKDTINNVWINAACSSTFTDTITIGEALSANFTADTVQCFADSVYLTSTISGGQAPYTYLWKLGNGDTSILAQTQVKYVASGTYTITLTAIDAKGCSDTIEQQIEIPDCPTIRGALYENFACGGEPVINDTLVLLDTNRNIISSVSAAITDTAGNFRFDYSQVAALDTAALYTFALKSGSFIDNIGFNTINTWINQSPLILALKKVKAGFASDTLHCFTDILYLTNTISGGQAPYIYLWKLGNGDTSSLAQAQVKYAASGTYTITLIATDAKGCSDSVTQQIIVPQALVDTISNFTNVTCKSANNGSIDLTVTGGTSPYIYNWSNGAKTEDLGNLAAGTYSITITDANGCTATTTKAITEPLLLTATATAIPVTCNGGSDGFINLTVTGGTNLYTYIWSNGANTEDLSNITAGIYSVSITDANGCAATANATITEPPLLNASATSMPVTCTGGSNGSINLTATGGTNPYTYTWSNGAKTENLNNLSAGDYSVSISDANDCMATANASISEPPLLTATTFSTDITCNGGSDGFIDLTVTGGITPYSYTWSNGAMIEDLSNITAGIYSVTVADANGCMATANASISEPPLLTATTFSMDITCNGNSDGFIDLMTTGGIFPFTYTWSNGAMTEDLNSLTAGTYSVTVTDANGCTATANASINEPALLTATAFSMDITCNGNSDGAIDLIVSGGTSPFTYTWSNGANTEDLSSLKTGTYGVIVTDANGCIFAANTSITEPDILQLTFISTNPGCDNPFNGAIDLSVMGGMPPYTYSWSNGAMAEDLNNLSAGIYSVVVSDANGCIFAANTSITEPDVLQLTFISTNPDCNNSTNGAIDITVISGTPPYTYSWSNGTMTEDLSNITAGIYSVVVADALGCSAIADQQIIMPVCPTIRGFLYINASCSGLPVANDTLVLLDAEGITESRVNPVITAANGRFKFDYAQLSILDTMALYTFTTKSGTPLQNAGFKTIPEWIRQSPLQLTLKPLKANFSYDSVYCYSDSVHFTGNIIRGKSPYIYEWDFGNGEMSFLANPVIKYASTGTYTVTLKVSDAWSCNYTFIQKVYIPDCPLTVTAPITGFLYENPSCGGFTAYNDTLILLDANKNETSVRTITGTEGVFSFSPEDLSTLYASGKYYITTKRGFGIQDTSARTINEWISQSPLNLTLAPVNQEWVAKYSGTDSLTNIATALDLQENVYVAGYSMANASYDDYVVIKYDAAGTQQWVIRYNGPGNSTDRTFSMKVDRAGNVYVTGFSDGGIATSTDITTIKYNTLGEMQWEARYNGPYGLYNGSDDGKTLTLDDSGNVYVGGVSSGLISRYSTNYFDYITIKYNSSGVQQWAARYNGTGNAQDELSSIAVDNKGNVYVTGGSMGVNAVYDFTTIKYNMAGEQQWVARDNISGYRNDYATAVKVDASGNIYISGQEEYSHIIIKYNSNGEQQWVLRSSNYPESSNPIVIDNSGYLYIIGGFGMGSPSGIITKIDTSGTIQWLNTYDGTGNFSGSGIAMDESGNPYVTGIYHDTDGKRDYLTIKYNSQGIEQWRIKYNGNGNYQDNPASVAVSNAGNVYVTGTSWIDGYRSDIATVKYSQCPATAPLLKWDGLAFEEKAPKEKLTGDSAIIFVNVYPNPNNGSMQIEYVLPEEQEAKFAIFDLIGKRLKSYSLKGGKNTFFIADAELQSGVYFYQVISNKQRIKQDKLVIIR